MPDEVVVEDRVNPVSSLVTVTFAPEITAPVGSVTSPRSVPLIFWAKAGIASSRIKNEAMDSPNFRIFRLQVRLVKPI
jgi:hypothetical protein